MTLYYNCSTIYFEVKYYNIWGGGRDGGFGGGGGGKLEVLGENLSPLTPPVDETLSTADSTKVCSHSLCIQENCSKA